MRTKIEVEEDRVLQAYRRVIPWLEALGITVKNTRYARYERHIEDFYSAGLSPLTEEAQKQFKILNQSYRECIDICLVHKCFEHTRHPNLISILQKVVSGQDTPELSAAGAPRNFLFELLVAARFISAGYDVDFEQTNDVVAKREGLVVRVECKRLGSENQLEKRVSEAGSQLRKSLKAATDSEFGIIYVDVSSCISSDISQVVETAEDAKNEINKSVNGFLTRNARLIEDLNQKYIDISNGICLVGTLPIWSSDFVLHASACTQVRTAGVLSDDRYYQFQQALNQFDDTFQRLFD